MNFKLHRPIKCKYLSEWSENQSPYGSGLYWPMHMIECMKEDDKDFEPNECDENCSGYIPMALGLCEKHGEFIIDEGCDGCRYGIEDY